MSCDGGTASMDIRNCSPCASGVLGGCSSAAQRMRLCARCWMCPTRIIRVLDITISCLAAAPLWRSLLSVPNIRDTPQARCIARTIHREIKHQTTRVWPFTMPPIAVTHRRGSPPSPDSSESSGRAWLKVVEACCLSISSEASLGHRDVTRRYAPSRTCRMPAAVRSRVRTRHRRAP
jgi:hypothetical protein